ncbi:MAG: glycosyltransferase family 4 protein, partial [Acidobacteria bacterium]|nr:glycosyltransferase family 4 protein [Acidobacteriota bacterium]
MKTAFIHDWLVSMRGGEKVLQELCVLFPDATVFTLFHVPGSVSPRIESMPIRVSPLNRLPGLSHYYRNLLPFMPWAVSTFDLRGYDLIISNSHAVAKGIRKPPGSFHICSCLTPMRFIWDMRSDYFHYGDRLGLRRSVLRVLLSSLRNWDRRAAASVDCFIANSHHVKQRIARVYGRTSDVIYSPVDTTFFTPDNSGGRTTEPFFLIVSALVSYKRIDLAIDVFNRNGRPLLIVGQGPDLKLLKKRAKRNIEFKGFVSEEELRSLYRTCAAVILPGREDFGLVPLEAQACGRPAIAFASGGATETITDGSTGILFQRQEPSVLQEAIDRFMRWDYDPALLRANAER